MQQDPGAAVSNARLIITCPKAQIRPATLRHTQDSVAPFNASMRDIFSGTVTMLTMCVNPSESLDTHAFELLYQATSKAKSIQTERASQMYLSRQTSERHHTQREHHCHQQSMCVEIHHILACGHYNEDFPNPFGIRKCQYPGLTDEDKRFSDRVNGKHRVMLRDPDSYDIDHSAVCEEYRGKENQHLRRRQPLKWPNVRETI